MEGCFVFRATKGAGLSIAYNTSKDVVYFPLVLGEVHCILKEINAFGGD